ncbi:MAG TPA: serine/threonine-protein kinase [Gemmatimonadales bacterium]
MRGGDGHTSSFSVHLSGAFDPTGPSGGGPVNLRSPVPGDLPPLETGDQISRLRSALAEHYDVQRSVGEGGMAMVYLAQDLKHGRMVAIKVLRPELGASIGTDRFLREIRTAAQLQHPNILALYDSGEANGLLFYVMPFVEGESLRDRLNRDKQLPIEEAVMLVREAADALHFAHQHRVIHRDIKPENILLQGGHALVADFGIARALSEAGGEKLTQTGMAIGTPHYMSPEQGMGGNVDARSDVYSLGCVLYELLVGQPPFDGPNAMAILARHSMEMVPGMRVVRKTIPEELEAVVDEALEKTAADRFQSAADFSEALQSVDLSAVPRRHTTRVTISRVAARKRQRRKTMMLAGSAVGVLLLGGAGAFFATRGGGSGARPDREGYDPNSIAVLYFEGRGGDSLKFVADGLTEALIKELSGVGGLKVISHNGVRPYRGTEVKPDSIGRALRVGTLVSGVVAQSGDRLRVDVSLLNAKSGEQLDGTTLERPRSEIFVLQDSLAAQVSHFLRQRLGQEVRLRASRLGTRNTRAWELAQQAALATKDAESLLTAGDTAAARRQFATADTLYARAAEPDRNWVAPVTERARVAYRGCRIAGGMDKVLNDQCTRIGLELAEAAVSLDSTDADARELRGTLLYRRWLYNLEPDADRADRLFKSAEHDLRESIRVNPLQSSAWNMLSHLLANKAELAEAQLAARKAYESDPYLANANLSVWRLFSYAIDVPDPDPFDATHWCEEGERRFPKEPRFVECRLMIYALPNAKPDVPAAWGMLERYVELSGVPLREARRKRGEMILSMVLARAGLGDSAKRVAERARAPISLDPNRELVYLEAMTLGIIGDKDAAFQRLTEFAAASPQQAKNLVKEVSWMSRDLRSDPRWQQLSATAR